MSPNHNQNYSKKQITELLNSFKKCVKNGRYYISRNENRLDNLYFIEAYGLTDNMQKEILLNIQVTDFCHSLNNINKNYGCEELYVFIPTIVLLNDNGTEEKVDVYVKFKIKVTKSSKNSTVVISFHKRKKPADYLFKNTNSIGG